jgi:hypothetical protein
VGDLPAAAGERLNDWMARFLTILTGRDLPQIRQPREPEPSTINEKTIADFARVVEQTGILKPAPPAPAPDPTLFRRYWRPAFRRYWRPALRL